MFTRGMSLHGPIYRFDANGYDFHVLHSFLGTWTVYQMELEPGGRTFLDENALVAHYPVANKQLRAIVNGEVAHQGANDACATEGLAP